MSGNVFREHEFEGWCPICEHPVVFRATKEWLREGLLCTSCTNNSVPRERALAHVLSELRPNWRSLKIHESSPTARGISYKLSKQCESYTASQYFPNHRLGDMVGKWLNINLEEQSFPDASFDVVVSLDVMEHVFHPDRAWAEIYRTLKPGGVSICTFPINGTQQIPLSRRASLEADGVIYLKPAEYHGNPIDPNGSLVTFDYGHDVHDMIGQWTPFSVTVLRFCDRFRGILGKYTEVVVCEKLSLEVMNQKGIG